MSANFTCAGCGIVLARDTYESDYEMWKAVCTHFDEVHPELRARARTT